MGHVTQDKEHVLETEIVLMDFAVAQEIAKETSLVLPQIGKLG